MSEVTLLPAWKNAAAELFGGRYGYGDLVPHDVLHEAFRLPRPEGRQSAEVFDKWRLAVCRQLDQLSSWLLEERSMCLVNEIGQGYRVLLPEKQTAHAMDEGMRKVRRDIRKMAAQAQFVDRSALTNEQAMENANALARIASMRQMLTKASRMKIGVAPKLVEKG